MRDEWPLILGEDVTVGHSVTLHGCTIESLCLIGMGAIILNGARIGAGSIVAAGTLVTERTVISPGSLVMGAPAKVKRALSEVRIAHRLRIIRQRYVGYKNFIVRKPRVSEVSRRRDSRATGAAAKISRCRRAAKAPEISSD